MSPYDLAGRKALVSGGAQGLGAGIAAALARAGAAVTVGDIDKQTGEATVAGLRASGARATFVSLDVTNETSWEFAIATVVDDLGGLDIVVNNAGVEISGLIANLDPEDLRRMLEVNVLGTALGTKHALRTMRPGGMVGNGGAVVNVSSVTATIAFPGTAGYSATQSGIDRLSRVAAAEAGRFGYGIRVNCVHPGLVATDMGSRLAEDLAALGLWPSAEAAVGDVMGLTPLGRLGEVADIADAVVFLASDAARFITGVGLPVDGGMGM
jgi:3alpha(or 20beta)-hydroxysteroid dehydrogenase